MIEPLEQAAGRLEGGADMEFGMPFLMETDTLEECARLCSQLGLGFIELNEFSSVSAAESSGS